MSLPPLPLTLRSGKRKSLLLLLASSVFVAGGVLMILHGKDSFWPGVASVSFFGFGILISIFQLHPKSSGLVIDEAGLEIINLFRKSRIKWTDIAEFGVMITRVHGVIPVSKSVGMNFMKEYHAASQARIIAKTLTGFEGALPDTYGLTAEELVHLLSFYHNEAKQRTDGP